MYKVFLPQIHKDRLWVGLQTTNPNEDQVTILAQNRFNISMIGGLHWALYEPNKDEIHPEVLDKAASSAWDLKAHRIHSAIAAQHTPDWATEDLGFPTSEAIPHYVRFCEAIIERLQPSVLQIYNEIDVEGGDPAHYGGWGIAGLERYVEVLEAVQHLRTYTRLAVGLMMPPVNPWLKEAPQLIRHLIDEVYFHHYEWWWPGQTISQLTDGTAMLTSKFMELKSLFGKSPSLTETNLLTKDASTFEYEENKAVWVRVAYEQAMQIGMPMIMFYHWQSNWNNANFWNKDKPLPAFEELANIARNK